ncbi:DUF6314 family protein [uncultured Jatrophihabitans sp.]|uniref:DUF6314 family protein n=1 Tax=uncultured Jatrophihabitans sp. TaxID=1610747 RepID=UPI0035C993BF
MAGAALTAPLALVGTWQLHRRLADLRTGTAGTMTGTLALSVDTEGVEWSESGVLHWTGRDVEVTRRYLLRDGSDGWWVYFDDGRPFHPWTPGRTVEHPCRADLYRGLVRVDSPHRWRIAWDVIGPAKHQRIVSRLVRRGVPKAATLEAPTHQEDR